MRPNALGALAEMTQRLLDDPDLGVALQRVTDTALRIVEADHASVRLCAHDGRMEVARARRRHRSSRADLPPR